MKSFWTLPRDSDFFNRYANLTPTLYKLGFLAQIVSAFTEIGIIYSLVYSGLIDFWPQHAAIGAGIGAIVGTAFLEIGLRKFTPYSVQAILYKRFSGLDLGMSIFILLATVTLFSTSGLLSFKGSKNMVEAIAPEPEQQTTVLADSVYQVKQGEALEAYRMDSAEIAARYRPQLAAIQKAYASKVSTEQTNYRNLLARENRTGQSYATRKSQIRAKIKSLEAERDEKAAELEQQKAAELAAIAQDKKEALAMVSAEYRNAKKDVSEFNETAIADTNRKVNTYGGGLAYFTVICLFVFLLSVTLKEIHNKGSGVEQKVLPTQYDFSDTVFSEARNAINNRFQQRIRSAIRGFEEKTAPPPIPITPNELYNIAAIQQPVYNLNYEEIPEQQRTLFIQTRAMQGASHKSGSEAPDKALEYLAAAQHLEKAGLNDQAKEMQLKADQVLNMYLGPEASDKTVGELKQKCIDHLKGDGPNPFGHHHRRPIGFNPSGLSGSNVNNGDRYNGENYNQPKDRQRQCKNCRQTFTYKHWNKQYCSDECKLDYHAQQHGGQRFNPKQYHKKNRK